ncbi:MAG TPA: lysophospholipid acyltransferase family protein [Solirubrobacteraceae bacterium]|nr:lysophospholipid acyltransferase family protein [Solirubrobacteraceae bacterium]
MTAFDPYRYASEHGVSRPLYAVVRALATVLLRSWFRLRVSGAEHLPAAGPAIVAANHKSLLDPFFLGLTTHRDMRFMAKSELFRRPFGRLLAGLGAFPVRRGAADADALATARAILEQGGVLIMFPEGTRVDEPDALGSPHHGAGRLAVETGAPLVPAAILGTSRLWLGPIPKPRRIDVAYLPPVAATSAADAAELIDRSVWPAVQDAYGRLRATPGALAALLTAIGLGGFVAARRRTTTPPRILGVVPTRRKRRRAARDRWLKRFKRRRTPRDRLLKRLKR